MPKKQKLDLATFDGQMIDGLEFCGKVYDLFDQMVTSPDSIKHIRLRSTRIAKKLIEELIPIARYVQARYREGRRIKVKWFGGSQAYDAILWSRGDGVKRGGMPRKLVIEVTTAGHEDDYLRREQLHVQGMSFGPKKIWRDRKTRQIISEPYVYGNDKRGVEFAEQILKRLKAKSAKHYPAGTALVILCFPDGLILDSEWTHAVELVKTAQPQFPFREVFLYEPVRSYAATLYGQRHGRRR